MTLQGTHSAGHSPAAPWKAPRPPPGSLEVTLGGPQGLLPPYPHFSVGRPLSRLPDPTRVPGDQMRPPGGGSRAGTRAAPRPNEQHVWVPAALPVRPRAPEEAASRRQEDLAPFPRAATGVPGRLRGSGPRGDAPRLGRGCRGRAGLDEGCTTQEPLTAR